MTMRVIAGRALGALALAGALTGLAAGVAEAKPDWGHGTKCENLHYSFTTYYSLALSALEQGDKQASQQYDRRGDFSYSAYVRAGCAN